MTHLQQRLHWPIVSQIIYCSIIPIIHHPKLVNYFISCFLNPYWFPLDENSMICHGTCSYPDMLYWLQWLVIYQVYVCVASQIVVLYSFGRLTHLDKLVEKYVFLTNPRLELLLLYRWPQFFGLHINVQHVVSLPTTSTQYVLINVTSFRMISSSLCSTSTPLPLLIDCANQNYPKHAVSMAGLFLPGLGFGTPSM